MKKFFRSIGIWFTIFTFSNKLKNQKNLTNFFRSSTRAIVITPVSKEQKILAIPFFEWLQQKFSFHHLTIITFDTFADIEPKLSHCNVLTILQEHKNIFGFLNESMLAQINNWETDTIIDLTLEDNPTTLNILKNTKYKMAIGFNKKGSEKIFTVIVNQASNPFEQMKQTLSMF